MPMHPIAELMDLEEALRILLESTPRASLPAIRADRDDPALDRSAMDGYALRSEEGTAPRRVAGTLHAGMDPAPFRVEPGTCLAIMTGACVPEGADAVVPLEQVRREGDQVWPDLAPRPGDHIRRRGEQAKAGQLLLPHGSPLTAPAVGLLASIGEPLPRRARPRVAIVSTGDEVVSHPGPHQIRDANGPMLAAFTRTLGAKTEPLPALPDDLDTLERFLREASQTFDVIITSGGVSAGERDLLPEALTRLGARLLFRRIRLKPGKPMLAARLDRAVILGLPGNPVSAYLNALLFLPPVLDTIRGLPVCSPWIETHLAEAVPNPGDRPLLMPCRLAAEGLWPLPSRGSADLVRLAQAHACAWIPEGGAQPGPVRALRVR